MSTRNGDQTQVTLLPLFAIVGISANERNVGEMEQMAVSCRFAGWCILSLNLGVSRNVLHETSVRHGSRDDGDGATKGKSSTNGAFRRAGSLGHFRSIVKV